MFADFQTRGLSIRRTKPSGYAALLLVCLALLAILTVAQVAHTHANSSDADHCPLCIVMHTAVPVVAAATVVIAVEAEVAAPVLEVREVARHWHPQLFTRPPPTGC